MTSTDPNDPELPKAYFSRAGLIEGAVAMIPIVLSQTAFGVVFGTLGAQKGLTLAETVSMSGFVYAGLSQVVSLQSWPQDFTVPALLALALATAAVNLRFLLMSVTFRPWFGTLPAWQAYPTLLLTTDASWLRSMNYRNSGGGDAGFFLGGALLLYVNWLIAAVVGYTFASWIADPRVFGCAVVSSGLEGTAARDSVADLGRGRARRASFRAGLLVHDRRRVVRRCECRLHRR